MADISQAPFTTRMRFRIENFFVTVSYRLRQAYDALRYRLAIWPMIKLVAGLTVLTKVSYLALLIVPILAGIWQGVRLYANGTQSRLQAAAQAVDLGTERLATVTGDTAALTQTLSELQSTVERELNVIEGAALGPGFPLGFTFAFFAALFAVGGQLIYQLAAPEFVKDTDREDFIEKRRNRTLDVEEVIREAVRLDALRFSEREYMALIERLKVEDFRKFELGRGDETPFGDDDFSSSKRGSRSKSRVASYEQRVQERVERICEAYEARAADGQLPTADEQAAVIAKIHGRIAEEDYFYYSRRNSWIGLAPLVLYLSAILFVFAIVGMQVRTLLDASQVGSFGRLWGEMFRALGSLFGVTP